MAVLLLAEEYDIDLEDDIRIYLPELMDYGVEVSINSMLGHFSGMANYGSGTGTETGLNIKSIAGGPIRIGNEDYLSIDEFYEVVKKIPLLHPPNQQYRYSNLAYFLLSMLVEEVSNKSLREYANKQIFAPLGMTSTFFSDDPTEIVKHRAIGYKLKNDGSGYITDMTNLFMVGDGGLHTNLEDMLKWDQNFYSPKLGREPSKLLKQFNTPNSNHITRVGGPYANGQIIITEIDRRKRFSHSGGWLGTNTYYARFPNEQVSTITMCNNASLTAQNLSRRITNLYFKSK